LNFPNALNTALNKHHVTHRALSIACQSGFVSRYLLKFQNGMVFFVSTAKLFLCDSKASSLAGFGGVMAGATCQCA
jgi:hypothetical protein